MRPPRGTALFCLLLWGLPLWAADVPVSLDSDQEALARRVAGQLSCVCGTCPHIVVARCDCGFASGMFTEIRQLVAGGKDAGAVVAAMEEKYGTEVLGAPRAEGFNILAWVVPFLGLALGLMIVLVVVKRLKTPPAASFEAARSLDEIDPKYKEMLERELRE